MSDKLFTLGAPCPWCGDGSMVHDGGAVGYYCSNGFGCKQPSPWPVSRADQDLITNFEATFEDGKIQIHVGAGEYTGHFTLSDQFMAGVRATFTEELVEALKGLIAAIHAGMAASDEDAKAEDAAADETFAALEVAEAALAKAEGMT